MSWRDVRSRTTKVAAVVTLPAVVAVLALVDRGFPLARVDLNDGGVWLTATSELRLGRFNAQVEELDSGLVTEGSSFDVLQDGSDVVLHEPGGVAVVDPATVALTTQVAAPGADASMAAGTVAIASGGEAWVRAVASLDGLNVEQDAPDVELGEDGAVVVARTGVAVAVGDGGKVTRVDVSSGGPVAAEMGTLEGDGRVDGFTAVGEEPVVLSGSTVRTLHGTVELEGEDLVLQQPGPQSSRVLVASRKALLEVPLDGGDVVEHPTAGDGAPAAPVQVGSCAHGAWATPVGSYLELCDGKDVKVKDLQDMSAQDQLVFRVNRGIVVLNDTLRGRVWMPTRDTELRVPKWQEVVPEEQPEEAEEESDTPQTTQDLVTECSDTSAAPVAADDAFGVRPNRTTILPVIDNDSSADCGILVVTKIDPLPPEFGSVQPIHGGRALQVAVAPGATGSVAFTYTIDDGRGINAPSQATVTLTVRAGGNEPPQQVRTGELRVEQGARAEHLVLSDFVDPDGDDLLLLSATTDPAAGTVRFRQDGTVAFQADGGRLGRARVDLVVSDGTDTVEGTLDVDIRPAGSLAPRIDPVHAVTYVGQSVTLRPLDAVRSSSAEPPRLAGVDDVVGATIGRDLQAGTFTFSAPRAGTYYVPFLVAVPPQQGTGLARIDVLEWPEQAQPPTAVRDKAYLPPGGEVTVDPLENDSDPAGSVLVLQSVEVPDGAGLQVVVLEHRLVQVRSERTLTEPVVLRYTVSNGPTSAVGEITVQPIPASGSSQPPVVQNVEASVRTGGVVTIPVLESASDPDGDRLTLERELPEPLGEGEGLLFVSGDVLRYQAPVGPTTVRAMFEVSDPAGNVSAAQLTVRVHASDATTKAPPRPQDLEARVFDGDVVRIPVPLVGIDADGDGVTLLGQASGPTKGRVTDVGPDWLEYQAYARESGTDTFTYAVEDWTGQRAVATVRVGIAKRPTDASTVVTRDDTVTIRPGERVEVRVLANDVDSGGGELELTDELVVPEGIEASVQGRRIAVTAPRSAGVYPIVYVAQNERGGRDDGVLTVTVSDDAAVEPPVARDVVVPAIDTIGRTEVEVDVLAVAQNPSGPLSDLDVEIPGQVADVARVTTGSSPKVVVTLVDHAQTLPYILRNSTDPDRRASYAFITVPALGFFSPMPRPKAPELRVASGAELAIDLNAQVQVAPGRSASISDLTAVTATKSDGSALVVDKDHLRFVSAAGYAGPASITIPVTDASGPGDTTARTAVISLPITVFAVDDHPPTFTPSTIAVAPGEPATSVDLAAFTQGPEGSDGGRETYSFQLTSAIPEGFQARLDGSVLVVSAPTSTPKGTTGRLEGRLGFGRTGSMDIAIDLKVSASTRLKARVQDFVIGDGAQGRERTVDVLVGSVNPFPETPLQVVSAAVETSGAGTASASSGAVTVRPGAEYVGTMVVRYVVRDATGDPDRQVEGRISVNVRGRPATPTPPRVQEIRDRTVVLSWDAPDNRGAAITGYRVVASPGGITRACASTTCTIDGLTNDVEYTFTVAAQNAVDWSDPSAASAPARPDAVPDAPGTPALVFGDGQLSATWAAPPQTGSPVTSYTVEISPAPVSGPATITSATTSATFRGLKNGTAYTVRVRAHNRAPEPSPWSMSSAPEVPAGVPGAPARVEAVRVGTPAGRQINVAWDPAAENGDAVRAYELTITGGPGEGTFTLSASQTSYPMLDAQNGVQYRFSVRAQNKAGWGSAATTNASTFGIPGAPGTPTASARAGEGAVDLRWGEADGNGTAIERYLVQVSDGRRLDVGRTLGTRIDGLVGGTAYTFSVTAVNAAGEGPSSAPSAAVTATTRPGRPNVDAVRVTSTANAFGKPKDLALSWSGVDSGGGQNLVYDWTLYGPNRAEAGGTVSGTTATVDISSWNMAWTGTDVTLSVRARTSVASGDSGQSTTTLRWGAVPGAPANVNLTPDRTPDPRSVTVTWDAVDVTPGVQYYDVRWTVNGTELGNRQTSAGTTQDALDTRQLKAGDVVSVVVRGHNERGDGQWSARQTYTLPAAAAG
ncbi:fibronectin type III domain-containing protein [Cellulomonas fimi]|uniref:Fibronectin type III domain protein n=1 Tax=Cellulomonas fimi (strain ATCC 484 / DSM 20113 / JCM 1341 / CCUG 24087 / LMG 16345 / NBRC 15513 / NCIMB 8980 / NCTC 7547 / NRS-133) TaxID=590998 RepID=F4H2W7_CELFA|nr:fibronectin type III domain-containing protein [Cellulomonas fimi]AEE46466.1 Fibronectin type III domain protein [Cellulomonas fimi ATCC 484]NNH07758.1 fibronectin type III domain-containing protein [Cellulomonas fimi]VEH33117.1 Fibronectin type III domain [Cellulomonas fimi]